MGSCRRPVRAGVPRGVRDASRPAHAGRLRGDARTARRADGRVPSVGQAGTGVAPLEIFLGGRPQASSRRTSAASDLVRRPLCTSRLSRANLHADVRRQTPEPLGEVTATSDQAVPCPAADAQPRRHIHVNRSLRLDPAVSLPSRGCSPSAHSCESKPAARPGRVSAVPRLFTVSVLDFEAKRSALEARYRANRRQSSAVLAQNEVTGSFPAALA